MASIFKKVEGIEEEKDVLGGSKFGVWNTGIYDVVIDSVYLDEAKSGAYSMNFTFKTEDGKELSETLYVTSGKEKGQLNYFVDKDGKKRYLPGYAIANAIAFVATGKELADLEPEKKIVEVYNYDLKKKVPTEKFVYMDLIGKPLKLGVIKVKEFKRVKDASGQYVDSDETKERNEINKIFSKDGLTITEIKAGKTEPGFLIEWKDRYKEDYVKDKTKGKTPTATTGGTTGSSAPSLFGGNK